MQTMRALVRIGATAVSAVLVFLTALALDVFLIGCLLFVLAVLGREIRDCHHRGRARIHRGTSWSPRIPRQETRS